MLGGLVNRKALGEQWVVGDDPLIASGHHLLT